MESFSEAWSLVCDYCKGRITEVAFTTWISRIEPVELDFAGNIAEMCIRDRWKTPYTAFAHSTAAAACRARLHIYCVSANYQTIRCSLRPAAGYP